ncbi:MAG: rhodanese-like domain-containing protein [Gaiellaceae bacterium]
MRRLVAEESAQLVEVPAAEYEDEHLARAISIPLKEVDAKAPGLLDRERPVIAYCYDYQ